MRWQRTFWTPAGRARTSTRGCSRFCSTTRSTSSTCVTRALDREALDEWVEMFDDEALYVVLSRENFDRSLPVGLIYCENKGMIRDRALALAETVMFGPRYLRHLIGCASVLAIEPNGDVKATANYMIAEVLFDRPDARLHQIGVYYDTFRERDGSLRLVERKCVYDSLLIYNAMCLPV